MKKKILALMLTCMTVLSLVACGGNETETKTDDTNVTTDTVVTEDAPMDAPVEKENWTDMTVTKHNWDAIGRHSAESFVLKECKHDELLSGISLYADIIERRTLSANEKTTRIITEEASYDYGYNPYKEVVATCYSDDVEPTLQPMLAGIKVTLSDKEPLTEEQKYGGYNELVLPAGITCRSTIAEVEAAYGAPTSTDVTAESCTVYRYDDADKHLVLEFDNMNAVHSFEYYYDLNGYTTVE